MYDFFQCQKLHHLPSHPTTMDCFPAQATALGLGIVTTYHSHPLATATATTPIHHLPHQPMSEPGPEPSCSSSYMMAGIGSGRGHSNVNRVTKAEAGCSPIRYNKVPFNEVLI